MVEIVSKPNYGASLVFVEAAKDNTRRRERGTATDIFQNYLDELEELLNANLLGIQVVATVIAFADLPVVGGDELDPPKDTFPLVPGIIFVTGTDKNSGNPVPAYSDGVNTWRYFSDNLIVTVAP